MDVTIVDDAIAEPTESFFVSIVADTATPVEVNINQNFATVFITDNDGEWLVISVLF